MRNMDFEVSRDKPRYEKCPKPYLKWVFVIMGMVTAMLLYLVFANIFGLGTVVVDEQAVGGNPLLKISSSSSSLTPDEELGYEKPTCKRLEQSGDRYKDEYSGEI